MDVDKWLKVMFHDDAELAGLLGEPLVFRETIQSRKESVVQLLITAPGRPRIYKTRVGGAYESLVFETVRHPMVSTGRMIYVVVPLRTDAD